MNIYHIRLINSSEQIRYEFLKLLGSVGIYRTSILYYDYAPATTDMYLDAHQANVLTESSIVSSIELKTSV